MVNSQGTLYLDHCDFSGSNATVLVYSEGADAAAFVRNTVLGSSNCERIFSQGLMQNSHFVIDNDANVTQQSSACVKTVADPKRTDLFPVSNECSPYVCASRTDPAITRVQRRL